MKDYKSLIIFLIPYLTFSGALYHISFWNEFNFNGMQYVEVLDLFKVSAPYIFSSIAIGIFLEFVNVFIMRKNEILAPGGGKNTSMGVSPNKTVWKIVLIGLWVLAVMITIYHNDGDPSRWLLATYVFALPLSAVLANQDEIIKLIPSQNLRSIIVLCIVVIPVASYAKGKHQAENIKLSKEYRYITRTYVDEGKFRNDTLKFLTNFQESGIFTDKSNSSIVFIKLPDTVVLKFFQEKEK